MFFQRGLLFFFGCVAVGSLVLLTPAGCTPPATPDGNSQGEAGSEGSLEKGREALAEIRLEGGAETPAEAATETPAEAATEKSPEVPPETTPEPSTQTPVWYGQVQTIVQENCQTCHQTGGVGPFPLLTYDEAKGKAKLIQFSVDSRRMPPWMPATESCSPLEHSRALTPAQIKTISAWVDGGTPAGDPKNDRPYQPKVDALEWSDVELAMQKAFTPSPASPDDYHCFLTEQALASDKELIGFQFFPGVREMVHHVLIYSAPSAKAKELSTKYPDKHWPCGTGAFFTQGNLLGVWVPGTDVVRLPKTTGLAMRGGEHVVLEIHYNLGTIGQPKPDLSKIQLQFAKTPVQTRLQISVQVELGLEVPPRSQGHEVKTSLRVPAPIRLWGFMPHMHKYGKKFAARIEKAGGSKTCLVDIPRWDYNWQQTFFFPTPLQVQAGDMAHITCTFDNPTDQALRWGERTQDEMCVNFYFFSTP